MSVSRFPKPPFTFEPADRDLVGYLQESPPWYLTDHSQELVRALQPGTELNSQRDRLGDLWEAILTDALRGLKRYDTRECGKPGQIDFESFFDKHSLGMDRLRKALKAFTEFEGLMYGARPGRYRDHVTHTFRVWVIGQGLLKRCLKGRLTAGDCLDSDIRCKEWECIWAVTALCHDIGYPLTALETISEKTRETLRAQGLHRVGDLRHAFSPWIQPLQETILQMMSSKLVYARGPERGRKKGYLTHLQNKYYLKFLNSLDRQQHGVVSAIIVGKSLVYFLESDLCQDPYAPLSKEDARQFLIRREILRAIAAHTCSEIYHVRFNTLAFLLFIVDELQCWGRPTLQQLMSGGAAHEEDRVKICSFGRDDIEVQITAAGEWDRRETNAAHQLTGIHTRLRLAVDTPLLRDCAFRFQISSEDGGKACYIKLDDGKITEGQI